MSGVCHWSPDYDVSYWREKIGNELSVTCIEQCMTDCHLEWIYMHVKTARLTSRSAGSRPCWRKPSDTQHKTTAQGPAKLRRPACARGTASSNNEKKKKKQCLHFTNKSSHVMEVSKCFFALSQLSLIWICFYPNFVLSRISSNGCNSK